jgi:hypothetical protein
MSRAEFPRIYELIDGLKEPRSRNAYFQNFDVSIRNSPVKWKVFADVEAQLAGLKLNAWNDYKLRVGSLFENRHAERGWQAALNELHEANAYNYLTKLGCTSVEFVPRTEARTPDLRATLGKRVVLCEVKTINRSRDAVTAQRAQRAQTLQAELPDAFFNKLAATVRKADEQMAAYSNARDIKRIVYIVVQFDDWLHEQLPKYLDQMRQRVWDYLLPSLEIVFDVKPEFYFATIDPQATRLFLCTPSVPWTPLK